MFARWQQSAPVLRRQAAQGEQQRSQRSVFHLCPSSARGCGAARGCGGRGGGGGGRCPARVSAQPASGSQAARSAAPPGPAPRLPPHSRPCARRGLPQIRAGAAAANERSRRLRELGRLCPLGIGHAVGSGRRGLGAPRPWLGQACCWVTGRRVSPGNGGGYRSLAGREGGGAGRRQVPQTPATARAPRPPPSGNLHRRAGHSDPADAAPPAAQPPGLQGAGVVGMFFGVGGTQEDPWPRRGPDSGPAVQS